MDLDSLIYANNEETGLKKRLEALYEEAVNAACMGSRGRAAAMFFDYVAINPRDAGAWIWLGYCIEDRSRATYCMRMAMQLDPTNIEAARIIEQFPQIAAD